MYQYIKGEWKTLPNTLDKAKTEMHLTQQLKALGFQDPQELVYRGGDALLYSRGAPSSAPPYPFAFGFCCVLSVGNGRCPVGLKDLQDVQLFLEEIDAHPRETPPPIDFSWLRTTLNQLNNTLTELSTLMQHLHLSQAPGAQRGPGTGGRTLRVRSALGPQNTGPQTQPSQPLFDEDDLPVPLSGPNTYNGKTTRPSH